MKWLGKEIDKFVPVLFQKMNIYENQSEDTRFLKVKIWLMHLGENLNGSYFSKESVETALPTLANTPILAYIEDNSNDDVDFSDHRMVLVKKDNEIKIKYLGQAIGVIPEDNNAQFEMRLCDDGIEREFLTCEGLVWTKWDEPIDIFDRDVFKAQSMELHDDFTGEWKDGMYYFNTFKFFGACALGSDVLPAMRSASIETQFSNETLANEVQVKMEQFKQLFSNKGGKNQMDEKLDLLVKYSVTEEELIKQEVNIEEYSLEDLETKLKELSEKSTSFSLTGEQFIDELRNELSKEKIEDDWGWAYNRFSYIDYKDGEVYAFDRADEYKLYGFIFTVDGDSVTIDFDSKKRKKFEVVDFLEGTSEFSIIPKEALEYEVKVAEKKIEDKFTKDQDEFKQQYSNLENEVESLRAFKKLKVTEERFEHESQLFNSFSSELTEEEMKTLKDTASEFSLEQLEEKLFVMVGKKKASFSKQTKKEKQTSIKIELDRKEEKQTVYGGLFEKYSQE